MKSKTAHLENGTWLVKPATGLWDGDELSGNDAYVGIDFGTATTVASLIIPTSDGSSFTVEPLRLAQPSAWGGELRNTLVNTVLSWRDGRLLFGVDAYQLRPRLQEGKNTFSSFKMGLGLDLGPEYPNTVLADGRVAGIEIKRPADAVREFFKLLVRSITTEVHNLGKRRIHYAFTVPAAFQANQRRDLLAAIRDCGIDAEESCLIDEPNAAFLSYIYESARSSNADELLAFAKKGGVKILVFDFGAGTCDVSILEFTISPSKVSSRNLAISKFTALGGDDIDRAIVNKYLVDQIRSADGEQPDLTARDLEELVTKRLMPAAEQLKIAISENLSNSGVETLKKAKKLTDLFFHTQAVNAFKVRGQTLSIEQPSLSVHQFLEVMSEFCGDYNPKYSKFHVAGPVNDVLDKAGLAADEINAVLFIGGSSSSALIRSAVMDCFTPEVAAIVPRDLRVHVSQGAAIHSFGIHRMGLDLIVPITSDPICVITRGRVLETLIPVSSPVPMPQPFEIKLEVPDNNQQQVDVPICSGTRERLVGIVSIKAGKGGFKRGDVVRVVGDISKEKVLDVKVTVAGVAAKAEIMSPLSNGAPGPAEIAMLKEKQNFNESVLRNGGRPDPHVVRAYSQAAANAGAYELAADLLVALERITPNSNYATNIGFYYNQAGRNRKGNEWHHTAYIRNKNEITAYNMYCISNNRADEEKYLRESIRFDPNYISALQALASLLEQKSPDEAKKLNHRVVNLLSSDYEDPGTDIRNLEQLLKAARATEHNDLSEKVEREIQRRRRMLANTNELYSEDHLAASSDKHRQLIVEK